MAPIDKDSLRNIRRVVVLYRVRNKQTKFISDFIGMTETLEYCAALVSAATSEEQRKEAVTQFDNASAILNKLIDDVVVECDITVNLIMDLHLQHIKTVAGIDLQLAENDKFKGDKFVKLATMPKGAIILKAFEIADAVIAAEKFKNSQDESHAISKQAEREELCDSAEVAKLIEGGAFGTQIKTLQTELAAEEVKRFEVLQEAIDIKLADKREIAEETLAEAIAETKRTGEDALEE